MDRLSNFPLISHESQKKGGRKGGGGGRGEGDSVGGFLCVREIREERGIPKEKGVVVSLSPLFSFFSAIISFPRRREVIPPREKKRGGKESSWKGKERSQLFLLTSTSSNSSQFHKKGERGKGERWKISERKGGGRGCARLDAAETLFFISSKPFTTWGEKGRRKNAKRKKKRGCQVSTKAAKSLHHNNFLFFTERDFSQLVKRKRGKRKKRGKEGNQRS